MSKERRKLEAVSKGAVNLLDSTAVVGGESETAQVRCCSDETNDGAAPLSAVSAALGQTETVLEPCHSDEAKEAEGVVSGFVPNPTVMLVRLVTSGVVVPVTDVQQDEEEKPTLGYTDWSVAKALGVKRRRLVRLRQTGKAMRDIDWTCINGEVCMTHQWCSLHVPENKLSLLSLAGVDGLVSFEVKDFVQNPHMVIGRRIDNNTLEVIHIANRRDYHKGMQFEARRRTGGGYTVAYRIPRSDY